MSQQPVCGVGILTEDCTLETCCIQRGSVEYLPSLGGNVAYLAIFAICMIGQLFFGIKHKTWGFMVGMVIGTFGEVVGYGGRVWMHYNIFQQNPFLVYLVPLTIAPALLTASIYLTLGRIIQVYGAHMSLIPPGLYTVIFVTCDFISLLLQAIGGAITSMADPGSDTQDMGVNIMIAGLSFQVASLALFIILASYFGFMVYKRFASRTPKFASLTGSTRFHVFEAFLAIATFTIFVRCIFRVAELKEGFSGHIANSEPLFMIFEGPMIFIAVGLLTILHPGVAFCGHWGEANFGIWARRSKNVDSELTTYEAKSVDALNHA